MKSPRFLREPLCIPRCSFYLYGSAMEMLPTLHSSLPAPARGLLTVDRPMPSLCLYLKTLPVSNPAYRVNIEPPVPSSTSRRRPPHIWQPCSTISSHLFKRSLPFVARLRLFWRSAAAHFHEGGRLWAASCRPRSPFDRVLSPGADSKPVSGRLPVKTDG